MLQRATLMLSGRVVPSWLRVGVASRRQYSSSNEKRENVKKTLNSRTDSDMARFFLQGTIPKQIPRHLHDDFIQLTKYEQERIYEKYSKLAEAETSSNSAESIISVEYFTLNQRRQIVELSRGGLSADIIALQFRVPVEGIDDVLEKNEELRRKKPSIEDEIWINQRANSLMKESPWGFKTPDAYKRVRAGKKRVIRDYKQRKEAYPPLLENPDPKVENFHVSVIDSKNSPV